MQKLTEYINDLSKKACKSGNENLNYNRNLQHLYTQKGETEHHDMSTITYWDGYSRYCYAHCYITLIVPLGTLIVTTSFHLLH